MADSKPRMQERYEETIRKAMVEKHGYKNPHQIPAIEKITLNMGVGSAIGDKKILDLAVEAMTEIAGQKPVITMLASRSQTFASAKECRSVAWSRCVANECMNSWIGWYRMVLPRVRDFRGISRKAFDGNGNYTLGLTEQLVFPELNPDKFTRPQGMNITIVTSAKTNDEARDLLEMFGMPFKQDKKKTDAA